MSARGTEAMKFHRLLISFVAGSVVVMAMLVLGVNLFYERERPPLSPFEAVEIEFLTPEEAARLLGEEPPRRSLPEMPAAAPAVETASPQDDRG